MIKNNFNIRNTYSQINTNPIEDLNNHLFTIIDLARKIKGKENHNLNEVEKLLKINWKDLNLSLNLFK
jgi:hypothetical protein